MKITNSYIFGEYFNSGFYALFTLFHSGRPLAGVCGGKLPFPPPLGAPDCIITSLIGGTYGRIIGKTMVDLFGIHTEGEWAWMDPGAFALIGAASFFGGVSRLTMSLTVIMVRAVSLYLY